MIKQSVKDIIASGGEVTYKKLSICDLHEDGTRRPTLTKRYQLESRYGAYETTYNSSVLYDDLDVAADRFILIYNMIENGELK